MTEIFFKASSSDTGSAGFDMKKADLPFMTPNYVL